MRRLSSGFLALIGIFVVFSLPAWADDRDSCNNLTGDESIAACTRLIASKELQGDDLARAYRSRALSYTLFKGDYDRAIADFSEAIRLDPNNPLAYAVRGASFVRKGDYDRALTDLNEAAGSVRTMPQSTMLLAFITTRRVSIPARSRR